MKKHYQIVVPVERASGERLYEAWAESRQEALRLYYEQKLPCLHEELEAEELGEPEVSELK